MSLESDRERVQVLVDQITPLDQEYAGLVVAKEAKAAELEALKAQMRAIKETRDPLQLELESVYRRLGAAAGGEYLETIQVGLRS